MCGHDDYIPVQVGNSGREYNPCLPSVVNIKRYYITGQVGSFGRENNTRFRLWCKHQTVFILSAIGSSYHIPHDNRAEMCPLYEHVLSESRRGVESIAISSCLKMFSTNNSTRSWLSLFLFCSKVSLDVYIRADWCPCYYMNGPYIFTIYHNIAYRTEMRPLYEHALGESARR